MMLLGLLYLVSLENTSDGRQTTHEPCEADEPLKELFLVMDGQIVQDDKITLPEFKQMAQTLDSNGDGVFSMVEVLASLEKLRSGLSIFASYVVDIFEDDLDDLQSIFDVLLDKNGDDSSSYSEFMQEYELWRKSAAIKQ
ncbi:hypothetical protein CHS0354_031770 [Potamilus streckersoni]|uniref:Uncharacterized protein n=1 Tax=Potamilus streckersoni TaxID=2493646 RepID=A0AAE0VKY7_9BIVA|nr:hypothetical protein CHS0354_031770 [Potamilus streckersoni]